MNAAVYVIGAYAVSALVLAATVAVVVLVWRRAKKRLAELTRISHGNKCIGAWVLRKLCCENDLLRPKETPDANRV